RTPQPLAELAGDYSTVPDVAASAGETGPPDSAVHDVEALRRMLAENLPQGELDISAARSILQQLAESGLPDWAPFEARLWLVERLAGEGVSRPAATLLDDLLSAAGARESAI